MNTFSTQLALARKQSKLTQSEVAEKLNVSFQAVSLWERGETSPDMDKLPEIARLFGVTTDWLLMDVEKNPPIPDIHDNLTERLFNEDKMYTYLKTYATLKNMTQTLKVLPYAKELHKGQYRKGEGKIPYIYHPLLVGCHAVSLGLSDDNLVSAALLHDVCEDCDVSIEELPVNDITKAAVALLTKDKSKDYHDVTVKEEYYSAISENEIATMVKLLDRVNNVSGMSTCFSRDKIAEYILETEQWFYPLYRKAKTEYPQWSNQLFLIKYHMTSVVESIKWLM